MDTDKERLSIRVHPRSSVVRSFWWSLRGGVFARKSDPGRSDLKFRPREADCRLPGKAASIGNLNQRMRPAVAAVYDRRKFPAFEHADLRLRSLQAGRDRTLQQTPPPRPPFRGSLDCLFDMTTSLTPRPHAACWVVPYFGERKRPRVRGSAPSLNPLTDVSDEGVADCTRGRVRSKESAQVVAISQIGSLPPVGEP